MTPTERLLTILRILGDARARDAASAEGIRDQMGVYEGAEGRRKWRRDIRTLRQRGLIDTDVTTAMAPNRTGIRLCGPLKPERLHLTRGEHLAINEARKALRVGMSAVSPLQASPDAAYYEVDHVTRILRFLEETGDEVELVQLAKSLRVPKDDVVELLDVLTREGVFIGGVIASFEFCYRDGDDEANDFPQPDSVQVIRGGSDSRNPTRGRGMDELGFFPYSPAETNDRLALIDQALAAVGLNDGLRRALCSAQRKLAEWQESLSHPEPMS